MSYNLNSLKGVYIGDYIGKGDTRSLDNGSYMYSQNYELFWLWVILRQYIFDYQNGILNPEPETLNPRL